MSRYILLIALVLTFSVAACAVPEGQHPDGGWKDDYESHHGRL